jgi:hypothetical protein
VREITVICAPAAGQSPTAAYLLSSEPVELTGANRVRSIQLDLHDAGAGKRSVRVPSVLFWKMVVFRFAEDEK